MSTDQIMSLLRQLLPVLGGVAVALGWIAPDKVAGLTATILSVAGPALILGGTIWSLISNTQSSIIKSASAIPSVQAMSISDPALAAAAKSADATTDVKVVAG